MPNFNEIEHLLKSLNSLLLSLLVAEHCGVLKSLNLSLVVKSVSFERLRALNQTLVVKSVSVSYTHLTLPTNREV